MTQRITKDQKDVFIEELTACGVIKLSAEKANVSTPTIYKEMKRSAIFKERVEKALTEGRTKIGESAIENIMEIARNENPRHLSQKLTANISLANAFVPGFRGQTKIEGRIQHDVKVITGIPRPNYELTAPKESVKIIDVEAKQLNVSKEDKEKLEALNKSAPINNLDKAINKTIEGEIINE